MLNTNAYEFLIEKIKEVNPDIDVREGAAIVDLFVKAGTLVFQPILNQIEYISNQQSLKTVDLLDDNSVDKLIANLFITRREGQKSSGIVRMFFQVPISFFIDKNVHYFTTDSGLKFYPVESNEYTEIFMATKLENNVYIIDVAVESEKQGMAYNIESGKITSSNLMLSGLLRVTNPWPLHGGINKETNQELVNRAAIAITARDMVTDPGIETILKENFSFISDLISIGYGDVEMERDLITGTNLKLGDEQLGNETGLHIGGKVDVWLKTTQLTEKDTYVDNTQSQRKLFLRPLKNNESPEPESFYFSANPDVSSYIVRPLIFINYMTIVDPANPETELLDHHLVGPTPECIINKSIDINRVTKGLKPIGSTVYAPKVTLTNGDVVINNVKYTNVLGTSTTEEFTPFEGAGTLYCYVALEEDNSPVILFGSQFPDQTDVPHAKIAKFVYDLSKMVVSDMRPDYDIVVNKPTLNYSAIQDNMIYMLEKDDAGLPYIDPPTVNLIGKALKIVYTTVEDIPQLQAYINANRVVCADILAKFMIPNIVSIDISYKGDTDADTMKEIVVNFINNMNIGQPLEMSDIVNLFYENQASYVKLATKILSIKLDVDGSLVYTESDDYITTSRLSGYIAGNYQYKENEETKFFGINVTKLS